MTYCFRICIVMIMGVLTASVTYSVVSAQESAPMPPMPMPAPAQPLATPSATIPPQMSGSMPNVAGVAAKPEGEPVDSKRALLMSALDGLKVPDSDAAFVPSYGNVTTSILLSDEDAELVRTALDRVERILASGNQIQQPNSGVVAERPNNEAPVGTPLPPSELKFRTHYVASILYRSPTDWMVWLNGKRVTPKRNKGIVRVERVTPDTVTLVWKASNWEDRMQVWSDEEPISAELKKIQARSALTRVDEQSRTVTAIMRQNQTWVTVRPMVVEGNHPEFGVLVKPDTLADKNPDRALAGLKARFSMKAAQKYMDTIAKANADKVAANSQKTLVEEATEAKQRTEGVQVAPSLVASQNAVSASSAQLAPTAQVQPLAAPIMSQPALGQSASLNDVLNAISNAAPPGGAVVPLTAVQPLPANSASAPR
jgi:hypothetical protein